MLHCNGIDPFVTLMGNFNWGPISRNDIVSNICHERCWHKDVMSIRKLLAYRVVITVSTDIVSCVIQNFSESHTVSQDSRMHCKVKMDEWPLI